MAVKIATAPCSWGVWYADGSPSGTPARLFLDQAQQAGYKALELGPDGYLPEDREELERELSLRGLEAASGTACYRFDQYERFDDFRPAMEKLCARVASMGGKYLVTMDESDVGLYSEKKAGYTPAVWKKYFTMFRDLGAFTQREYGLMTVYHPHIKSLIETEEEIVRLLDATGLNLCFDTGHHAYVNGNGQPGDPCVPDFIRRYAERVKYLHFKQVDGQVYARVLREHLDSDTAFDLDVMCDLPDGIIDFKEVKRALEDIHFDGIGVVESDMPKASNERAFASACRNLSYLREIQMIT